MAERDKRGELSLDRLSDDLVGSVRTPSLKERLASRVLTLFSISLLATLGFVAVLALFDILMIWHEIIEPDQRLVTQPVLMAMIGATIVELGAALTTIVIAVFKVPKKPPPNDASEPEDTEGP